MTRHSSAINTYSIGFGAPTDETPAARETARFLGTNHTEIICTAEDFNLLPKIVWHMDRPVGDALIIAFYKLAQGAARTSGSSSGAREPMRHSAGYEFHKVICLVERFRRRVPSMLHRGVMLPGLQLTPKKLLGCFFIVPGGSR